MLEEALKTAKNDLSEIQFNKAHELNSRIAFGALTQEVGLNDLKYDDVIGTSFAEKVEMVKAKSAVSDNVSPEEAEAEFLRLMELFRKIGNRNMYGNNCTVFRPPSGFRFNDEVANTYYHMYEGALKASEALSLLEAFLNASLEYAVAGGPKSMLRWILEVGRAIAMQEIENQIKDPNDVLNPTLTYLANQSYQSPLTTAYIFG